MNKTKQNKTKNPIPENKTKCLTLQGRRWMEQVSAVRNQKLMERMLSAHTGDISGTLILRL